MPVVFHASLGPPSGHCLSRPVSDDLPSRLGPRHCGYAPGSSGFFAVWPEGLAVVSAAWAGRDNGSDDANTAAAATAASAATTVLARRRAGFTREGIVSGMFNCSARVEKMPP